MFCTTSRLENKRFLELRSGLSEIKESLSREKKTSIKCQQQKFFVQDLHIGTLLVSVIAGLMLIAAVSVNYVHVRKTLETMNINYQVTKVVEDGRRLRRVVSYLSMFRVD